MSTNEALLLAPGSLFLGKYRVIDQLEEIPFGRAYEAELDTILAAVPVLTHDFISAGGIAQGAVEAESTASDSVSADPSGPGNEPAAGPFRLEVLYELKNPDDLKGVVDNFKRDSLDESVPPFVEWGITPDGTVYRIMQL